MAVFHCRRFPAGGAPIRTRLGLVVFRDGRAEVDDPALAEALRDVPAVFQIEEEGAAPTPAPARTPRPRTRKTRKED